MLYIKEISSAREIFNNRYPKWLNYFIYYVKYIFCIITIKDENNCYIPYKQIKNKFIIKLIIKMLEKQNCKIVLSKYLLRNEYFIKELRNSKIEYLKGESLFNYNILDMLKYIANVKKKEVKQLEISILINNVIDTNMIKYMAMNVKRVNIVTSQIEKFRRIEEELQNELGISILITNNKRKSLLKSEIIVNIDFDKELLELYQINRQAIIIQKEKQSIKKKSFNGVNIVGYEIVFENEKMSNIFYKKFENKDILLSMIDISRNYLQVIEQISNYNIKVVNLIGNKGIISNREIEQ